MTQAKKRRAGARPVSGFDVAARIGNADSALEADGVAVGTIAGASMLLPERVRRNATDAQRRALRDVFELVREHVDLLHELDRRVGELRRLGLSWDTIGWVTGLSAAGARKRWAH